MNEILAIRPSPKNPRARIRILHGEDDGHPYEVHVPLRIKTVEAALDWLRPANVPGDALRQGEFYFVPADDPHSQFCDWPDCERTGDHGGYWQEGPSHYRYDMSDAQFSRTHYANECVRVTKSGTVAFVASRGIRSHPFTGRPRFFVRGVVRHSGGDHSELVLPGGWHEVVPNRAHGPFPVRGMGNDD